jgi:hypothetical protein
MIVALDKKRIPVKAKTDSFTYLTIAVVTDGVGQNDMTFVQLEAWGADNQSKLAAVVNSDSIVIFFI